MIAPESETPMSTEVKICGLSTSETMAAAPAAGADYVGLVFHRPSPRHVEIETARRLADQARGRARSVAVVVDAPPDHIARIATEVRPDFIQAHGSETAQEVSEISTRTGIPVIKAIAIGDADDFAKAHVFHDAAAMILFDTKGAAHPGRRAPGGQWAGLRLGTLPKGRHFREVHAFGGLDPANVGRAIALTGAAIVDVSSGVERARGVKDEQLIRNFIEAVRRAS